VPGAEAARSDVKHILVFSEEATNGSHRSYLHQYMLNERSRANDPLRQPQKINAGEIDCLERQEFKNVYACVVLFIWKYGVKNYL
jgi:hypothetical protein